MYESNLSAADVAAVTRNNDGYGNGMFGNDWAWIVILLLFGWGRNGFGGFGGNEGGNGGYPYGCGTPATQADLSAGFANSAVLSNQNDIKLQTQQGFSNVQQTLCQGFNGVNTTVLQGFNGVERGFCDLSHQLSDCCCTTQRAIDGVNYNLATQSCDTRNAIANATRDITDNANANSRAILDFLTQDKIATLTAENQSLKFQASQTAQNAYLTATFDAGNSELIRRLGADYPTPAYVVQPPTPVNFPVNACGQAYGGCGCNTGCGSF